MKNTIRASHKNGNKSASAQSEKPSIRGQKAATIGHIKSRVKGKVTLGALRIGEALGLPEEKIKALALLAEWEGRDPAEYCSEAIQFIMQTSVDEAEHVETEGQTERARSDAANLLGALPNIFRRPPPAKQKHPRDVGQVRTEFEKALRAGEAIGLADCEVRVLASKAASDGLTPAEYCKLAVLERLFHPDHPCRAVPQPGRDGLWDALSKFEIVQFEANALLKLLESKFEAMADTRSDPFAAGIHYLTDSARNKITACFESLLSAYRAAFPTA